MRITHESKMADEEDDFVALGTPFEQLEEDAPRKKPVPLHEQVVTDDRGRRRFHGAFTGGFSAGYFNTVDTKEGWTPKTFVSSRSQKATERFAQRPEDFMDEEDLSEFGIAPKRVVTTQKFLPSRSDDSTSAKRSVSGGSRSAVLGANLLQDIIVPVKMSVGIKLLSQMGWKEGQGVGPKVRREAKKTYGCAGPPGTGLNKPEDEEDVYAVGLLFAPKDVESFEFTSKDDLHGIGYSGIDPKSALLSQRDWLGMDTTTSSIGIRGQGFGVGALEEEDEDVYAQDNLSKYDIELSTSKPQSRNDLHGWSGPQQTSGLGGMLSIFCKGSRPPPPRKHYPPPVVPRDFKPFHKPEEAGQTKQPLPDPPAHQKTQGTNQSSKRLTAKERGEALGEVPLPTPKKSIFDYIAEEDKTRLKESKEKANTSKERNKTREKSDLDRRFTSTVPLRTSGFKPFAKEPEKQARYEQYLSGKNDKDMPSQTDSKMTEWERECEMEEFARAAALYRPLNQTMAARFTSAKDTDEKQNEEDSGKKDQTTAAKMKMFGALTRERFEWHPDRVLCKRLNIPNPYPGSGVTGVVMKRREKSKAEEGIREVKAIDYKPNSSEPNQDEGKSDEHQDQTEMVQKPSALVAGFQSIVTQQKLKQPSSQDTSAETLTDKEEPKKPEQNVESDANVIKRAPMDLFNEIFAESSSESESESEENEEEKESKTVELDVKDKEEKTDGNIETQDALPVSDVPVHSPEEGTPQETLERRKEPSPETFGPALPSSFGSNTAHTSKGFHWSTRVNSPKRQEKQKHKKKKKRKEKDTGSDISDSDDGYGRRRKDKKKRSKKKGSDFTDSDGEYTGKTRKKKRSTKHKDSDSCNSESEESSTRRKNKTRSKHSDSEDKYGRRKKKTRSQDASDEHSGDDEHAKHRKKKRKDKEKSAKERKKSDRQEYEEIQYEPEGYIERNVHVREEKSSKSFESPEGSRFRKPPNYHEKTRDEASEKDARKSNSRTDNDSAKKQDISRVPANKEIIDKLKNIQMLKERKRMRAADFM